MNLHYVWENMLVNVETDKGIKKEIKTVEYDYDVEPNFYDTMEYLGFEGIRERAVDSFVDLIGWDNVSYDDLEDDEYFVEFMKQKYEEKAKESFEEENEAY